CHPSAEAATSFESQTRVTSGGSCRIDPDAIVISDVFAKKTRKTPRDVIERCRRRAGGVLSRGARKEEATKARKRQRLEKAGWRLGSTKKFLGLTDEEEAVIDLKLALAKAVREERAKRKLTQDQLGRLLGSSQSRIAKMEAGDPSVSIDLLVRSLLRMGAGRRDLIRWLARPARRAA